MSSSSQPTAVLRVVVTAAGQPLPAAIELTALRVQAGGAAFLGIGFGGGTMPPDVPGLRPGAAVTVRAGWGGAPGALLFDGVVTAQVLELSPASQRLTVQCQSRGPLPPVGSKPVLQLEYGTNLKALHLTAGTAGARDGAVTCTGTALAVPGSRIALAGLGSFFSGAVVATAVTHQIEGGDWSTIVAFGNAAPAAPPAFTAAAPARPASVAAAGLGPDAFGNAIVMDASGITLKTSGAICLHASRSLQLTCSQDLNASATNIKLAANLSLTATGAASAELSASGETAVKGAVVKIN